MLIAHDYRVGNNWSYPMGIDSVRGAGFCLFVEAADSCGFYVVLPARRTKCGEASKTDPVWFSRDLEKTPAGDSASNHPEEFEGTGQFQATKPRPVSVVCRKVSGRQGVWEEAIDVDAFCWIFPEATKVAPAYSQNAAGFSI